MVTLILYPKCSTCKRAKAWLDTNNIIYEERHIIEECPTKEEIKTWYQNNQYSLKRYFNTSGNLYKEMHLKEKLQEMTKEEQIDLLASNGMLVRRPLIIAEDKILIGFKESFWEEFFLQK